ncbi:GNAT family N-acetyltransferase [Hoeflea poritis]|uniref:GNAT family N-acetyltransferase n=1 Tax=Hoeflea poritis TaxID=2993659 RepID=A0ABT4VSK4_9HYPH|nr:GNAT family N-acetyltransferase [Hoeflea poritis]MDA4847692.1 GNAT family N-acetyltransferase [Hoeflea poritis]
MLNPTYTSRPATYEDARHLARLVNLAGDGLAYHHWQTLAAGYGDDIDPWAIGIRRAAGDKAGFSYTKSMVAEKDGKVTGCVSSYMIDAPSTEKDHAGAPAVFRPLLELEDMVVGSHHVNVLAVYPEHRGNGIGSRLLAQAEGLIEGATMSLIVSNANRDARRLYERLGYRRHASRPKIKGDWDGPGEAWILLVK